MMGVGAVAVCLWGVKGEGVEQKGGIGNVERLETCERESLSNGSPSANKKTACISDLICIL